MKPGPQNTFKQGVVAIVVDSSQNPTVPKLVDALSDIQEIGLLETALERGIQNPLDAVYQSRDLREKEDEDFGDYVEELLCQPFLKKEIQEQAVQWFRSKIKIDVYLKHEREATEIIANYAFQIFLEQKKLDFTLQGSSAEVRVRVYEIKSEFSEERGSRSGSGLVA